MALRGREVHHDSAPDRFGCEDYNGIAILIERPQYAVSCLQVLRSVEPDRQAIGILEDLDALVENHGESQYLALLDGESQVDRMIYVACLAPEHKILTRDLKWVAAGDLRKDEVIWSLDENCDKTLYGRFQKV